MDWKSQFNVHDHTLRDTCIVFLVLAVNLLILYGFYWFRRPDSDAACGASCASHQRWIYRIMSEVPEGEESDLPPEWTIADLIQEAVRKDRQTSHPLPEETFLCRNIRNVRVFFQLRRSRTEVCAPYFVFPAPASVVFDESLRQPVPVLMCPPGAHGKLGSCVLYSDGSVKLMTAEEAEKHVAKQSPTPIILEKLYPSPPPDPDDGLPADRQE